MAYRALERLINLHDGYRRAFRGQHGEMLLLQEDGEVALIDRICPHREAPLDNGPVSNGCITCPLHRLEFSLSTGENTNGYCKPLRVHTLVYEGNTLGIEES